LRDVLDEAGVRPAARAVYVEAADGFFESIIQRDIEDDRTLLVYAMNGEPLTAEHGSPLRVYIPNRYGMKQPKWIMRIEAIEQERPGYWVTRGWDHDAIVKTTAVIDTVTAAASSAELIQLTWLQWSYAGHSTPGQHVLRVRAYDGRGRLQPTANAQPHPSGASGVHAREFSSARSAAPA
jgi:DMSO/TMAO reductase YedYZ molybdopterin-dependent catalytic subunit